MMETERHHPQNGMGLHKIESFFSDIFSCGGCNFAVATDQDNSRKSLESNTASVNRSYSNSSHRRPNKNHSALQEEDFYRNHTSNHDTQSSSGHFDTSKNDGVHPLFREPGQITRKEYSRRNSTAKDVMIACDDDNDENSVLNETGTTYPDSFLNDSSLSLSSGVAIHERPFSRPPLQMIQEPQMHLPERKPKSKTMMVPTEGIVGTWPPIVVKSIDSPPRGKQPQHLLQHRPQHRHPSVPQEIPLLIPVRPPKIRRLTLDDALQMGYSPQAEKELEGNGPFHEYCWNDDLDVLPSVPESVLRSRSLDFLFSSERRQRSRKEGHSNRSNPYHSHHTRYCEEERSRLQLMEMLQDLNETYSTI